jgi:hypothetical protein
MSTRIEAFIPDTDKEYQKHKAIYDLCVKSRVSLPKETEEYFHGCDVPEDKLKVNLQKNIHYTLYNGDMSSGFDVDLSKLPQGVTKLRFYNSW